MSSTVYRSEEEVQLHMSCDFWSQRQTKKNVRHQLFCGGVTDGFNGRPPTEVHLVRDCSALQNPVGARWPRHFVCGHVVRLDCGTVTEWRTVELLL